MSQKIIRIALVTAFGSVLTMPMFAHATIVTTGADVRFDVSDSIEDKLGSKGNTLTGATTASDRLLGTSRLGKFDAATGVLTGVSIGLKDGKHEQVTQVTHARTSNGSNSGTARADGTGSSTVKLVIPTGVSSAASALTQTASCGAQPKDACTGDLSKRSVTGQSLAVGTNSLNAYAGEGNFGVDHVAASLSAETTTNGFNSDAATKSTVNWSGTLNATYSYLLHAAQSFDGTSASDTLTLDFGSVYLGDTLAGQSFSIFNLAGDRVGLQLTGFNETGDSNELFSTNLNNFGGLAAGAGYGFHAWFAANTVGSFGATYKLTLADVAPSGNYASNTLGAGYALTLNLTGKVLERPVDNEVPEPATLMLLGVGVAALAARRKRSA